MAVGKGVALRSCVRGTQVPWISDENEAHAWQGLAATTDALLQPLRRADVTTAAQGMTSVEDSVVQIYLEGQLHILEAAEAASRSRPSIGLQMFNP